MKITKSSAKQHFTRQQHFNIVSIAWFGVKSSYSLKEFHYKMVSMFKLHALQSQIQMCSCMSLELSWKVVTIHALQLQVNSLSVRRMVYAFIRSKPQKAQFILVILLLILIHSLLYCHFFFYAHKKEVLFTFLLTHLHVSFLVLRTCL